MNLKLKKIIIPIVCGLTIANMYYIQSIIPIVIKAINKPYSLVSMIYTVSLIGNLSSLIFLTPLGDVINRKKIISNLFLILFSACFTIFFTENIYIIYICAYFLGFGICIIPLTISYLSSVEEFGVNFIGKLMSGVLLGALLSRFASSLLANYFGWNCIYIVSSILMLSSMFIMNNILPNDNTKHKKTNLHEYNKLIIETISLLFKEKTMIIYGFYGFSIMAIFAAFWNNVSIYLYQFYHLDQVWIGFFSLTGVAGALSAIFSEKILKYFKYTSIYFFMVLSFSFFLIPFLGKKIIIFSIASIVIDAMIQLTHINNQRNIYKKLKGNESKAASCYMTMFILGGIFGAKISSSIYIVWEWTGVCYLCAILGLICFSLYVFLGKRNASY